MLMDIVMEGVTLMVTLLRRVVQRQADKMRVILKDTRVYWKIMMKWQ